MSVLVRRWADDDNGSELWVDQALFISSHQKKADDFGIMIGWGSGSGGNNNICGKSVSKMKFEVKVVLIVNVGPSVK